MLVPVWLTLCQLLSATPSPQSVPSIRPPQQVIRAQPHSMVMDPIVSGGHN